MQKAAFNEGLLDYLKRSPTPFHATSSAAELLDKNGFARLTETEEWDLGPGKYYVTRNGSSFIAFIVGKRPARETGIRLVGAHTDSPCLKLKPEPVLNTGGYLRLGVEVYGGVLLAPWFDRDLSLAGRLTCEDDKGKLHNVLIDFERAIATIPSLAIHLDREVNSNRSINPQKDIPPVLMRSDKTDLSKVLLEQARAQHKKLKLQRVVAFELSFYDTNAPAVIGLKDEFIASARLDNLLSCYTGVASLLEASANVTSLVVCNDHEEVGSASAEGAQGPFLAAVLERLLPEPEARYQALARSLLISTDNAHGIHPNYPDRHDGNHGPLINAGTVIKINANQRYATNSETAAYFRLICEKSKVPCQAFVSRTDMACGSTIGPLTAKEIGVRTLDVGVPTFGMHSIRELGGVEDAFGLHKALVKFYKDQEVPGAAS